MAAVTIRNLPDGVHHALKMRAVEHGRSTEAEIRSILESAVRPKVGLGSKLAAIGRAAGGIDIEFPRDASPVKPATFK
jgi:plasmid stability protein